MFERGVDDECVLKMMWVFEVQVGHIGKEQNIQKGIPEGDLSTSQVHLYTMDS